MPVTSARARLVRDLTTIAMVGQLESFDTMLDDSTAAIAAEELTASAEADDIEDREFSALTEELYDSADEMMEYLTIAENLRYHEARFKLAPDVPFSMEDMYRMREKDFRHAMRTTPACFKALLELIADHPVFQSTSRNPPPSPEHQLAVTLERLGSNGNGASLARIARFYKMSVGCVVTSTRRVLRAIKDRGSTYLAWSIPERREEISQVLAREGFPQCVGFVDGTGFPLWQRPGKDGEVFFDRKKRYSINAQIVCDCDRRITALYVGWPGSCSDTTVYERLDLAVNPGRYFSKGEYLIGDSAYNPSQSLVASYKGDAALLQRNQDFNWCVAKARVRNEHAIGILKGRWASLQELRLEFNTAEDMERILEWITVCVILHNMLASLGDQWDDLGVEEVEPARRGGADLDTRTPRSEYDLALLHREVVRDHAVAHGYETGLLPITE